MFMKMSILKNSVKADLNPDGFSKNHRILNLESIKGFLLQRIP